MNYYDGTKILSLNDINGNKPEVYLITTNRTGGKTTYFGRFCINKFIRNNSKFALLYRFNYELSDVAVKFFKDIGELFFPEYEMTNSLKAKGIFSELKLNNVPCGYALALNAADNIKKYSHLFNDVDRIIFDEFQPESNRYCSNELEKFLSIHTSIARGHGKQTRYVPVYMLGNAVTLLNPYYTALGIAERLQSETKFLRGDGFVFENGFIESASEAMKASGFNKAFSGVKYSAYGAQNVYLHDNYTFIEKPSGRGKYIGTLRYRGNNYGIREYSELGIIYCDDKADNTFPVRISVTTEDHNINYIMLKKSDLFIANLRYFFDKGCFRFKNLSCKEVILKTISY